MCWNLRYLLTCNMSVKIVLCTVILLYLGNTGAKIEGLKCRNKRYNGTCVLAQHCEVQIWDYWMETHPSVCGFRGKEPIICCTSCDLVDNINNIELNSLLGVVEKRNLKSWDECVKTLISVHNYGCGGIFNYKKIWDEDRKCHKLDVREVHVTKSPAQQAELIAAGFGTPAFPFMMLLGYGPTLEDAQWLCAGSVISSWYVVTAAHCISEPTLGSLKYGRLGIVKRSEPSQNSIYVTFSEIIPHPDYASPSKYHDIALLKVVEEVEFSAKVIPVCLFPGQKGKSIDHNRAKIMGWGNRGPNTNLSDDLGTVDVEEFTLKECMEQYPPHRLMENGFDNNTQLCFGGRDAPRDTCEGDSGGPLVLRSSRDGCAQVLYGVTSAGVTCGEIGAGLYTRVEYYIPWIESIVWP